MNNQPINDQTNREESPFPIFKTAAFLNLLFLAIGLLVLLIKSGVLQVLIYLLCGGHQC